MKKQKTTILKAGFIMLYTGEEIRNATIITNGPTAYILFEDAGKLKAYKGKENDIVCLEELEFCNYIKEV